MKKIITYLTILILGSSIHSLQGQLVITVAGQAEIPGNINGTAFEATFNNPHGIAVDLNGNVFTADRWSHVIRKITPDGMVSTYAGVANQSGDIDGPTSEALFYEPWGLCVDNNGNVYVADTRNNKIRKIGTDGIVSTVAGSGNYGTSNGPSTAATFGNPTGIECDNEGNLYVADHLTHIIRKIDNNGFVSTLAGSAYVTGSLDGVGTNASFNRPYGLTLDNEGNILVADEWNHKIRRITPEGTVTTVAGSGLVGSTDGNVEIAAFNYPWDMTVDSSGNIFVADGYNYVIRKITVNNQVSTFAGTLETTGAADGILNAATFSGATSVAYAPLTKEIFIGDAYNNLVRKLIDLNQGISLYINEGSPMICQGEMIGVTTSPAIHDSYAFYVDETLLQNSNEPTFNTANLSPGNHTIEVIANDGTNNFFSNIINVTVMVAETPTITNVGPLQFFEGDSVSLIASQANSYEWSTGLTTPTVTVFESGFYQVTISNESGCTAVSDPVEVVVETIPDAPIVLIDGVTVNGPTTLCFGTTANLSSSYTTNNQWFKNGWPIDGANSETYEVDESGFYQVQVLTESGVNIFSSEAEVTLLDPINLYAEIDLILAEPDDIIFFESFTDRPTNLLWDLGDGNYSNEIALEHSYDEIGFYTIRIIASDENGCVDSLVLENYVEVRDGDEGNGSGVGNEEGESTEEGDLYIPNAFTPNADGENDVFRVRGSNIQALSLKIFNHWGDMIYEVKNPADGWDGTHNGVQVQSGNYVYLATITDKENKRQVLSGHVVVLR